MTRVHFSTNKFGALGIMQTCIKDYTCIQQASLDEQSNFEPDILRNRKFVLYSRVRYAGLINQQV
jgi:hypothetical protein